MPLVGTQALHKSKHNSPTFQVGSRCADDERWFHSWDETTCTFLRFEMGTFSNLGIGYDAKGPMRWCTAPALCGIRCIASKLEDSELRHLLIADRRSWTPSITATLTKYDAHITHGATI